MLLSFFLVFGALASGCDVILDVGDHYLRPDEDSRAADGSSSSDHRFDDGDQDASVSKDGSFAIPPDADASSDARYDPVVIATGQQRPGAIRIYDTEIFWINEATEDGGELGAVMRMAKDGGSPPTALAAGRAQPKSLRIGNLAAFFTDGIGRGNDAGDVNNVGVFKVFKSDGMIVKMNVDDGFGAGALAFHNSLLYSEAWAVGEPTRLRRSLSVLSDSGPVDCYPYIASSAGRFTDIVVDDSHAYLIDTAANAIVRSELTCGSTAGTVFAANQGAAHRLIYDLARVYWATATSIYRQDKTNAGGQPTLLAEGALSISDLAATGSGIVFADEAAGTILYTDLSIAPHPILLASGQKSPNRFAVDAVEGVLYWTNREGGEIVRMYLR